MSRPIAKPCITSREADINLLRWAEEAERRGLGQRLEAYRTVILAAQFRQRGALGVAVRRRTRR